MLYICDIQFTLTQVRGNLVLLCLDVEVYHHPQLVIDYYKVRLQYHSRASLTKVSVLGRRN